MVLTERQGDTGCGNFSSSTFILNSMSKVRGMIYIERGNEGKLAEKVVFKCFGLKSPGNKISSSRIF